MKPSGLTKHCTRCGELMPYDPSARNQLCNSCNRLLAFGGDSLFATDEPSSGHESNQDYSSGTYSALPQQVTPAEDYQDMAHTKVPQPNTIPPTESTMYSTHQPSQKRKYDTSMEDLDQYPNKRSVGNAYAPHTPSSLRQNVWPPTFDTKEMNAVAMETEDEGEEEFVDAPEDLAWDAKAAIREMYVAGKSDVEGEVDEAEHDGLVEDDPAAVAEEEEGGSQAAQELPADEHPTDDQLAEDDDLFRQTFGNKSHSASGAEKEEDDSDVEEIVIDSSSDKDFDRSAFIASLQSSSKSATKINPTTNTTSSTKPKRKPFTPAHITGTIPAEIPKHIGFNFRKQFTFHTAAVEWVPRLPLAEHRYWIGVLKLGVKPRGNQSERNFIWMKGNKLTTVETIWRAYCQGTVQERDDVVLLLGYERPGMRVRCEELDYYNDKRIIFRAVHKQHKDAKGRGLCEELIKERVVLDEDEGEKAVEVIEID